MADLAKEVLRVNIEDEMKQSYLDYAMSVIVGRALPDVRDGLKPVHRRVLFAMKELGNDYNKPYKKSARVVGDVIGKYHPHGDNAVYDTIVRMAQPFSLRYLLVDGQGNFGSVDGDPAAAMRYTEVRLTRLAHELMRDLDKGTVDFLPNYDDKELEPSVLPAVVPNLLINGSSGIAVGMATNIPPHNLREVVDALVALIADPELTIDDLMQYVTGPDFPTAGIINGSAGIREAYRTGRGRIRVRGKAEIEPNGNRESIIITELPYQVNKARLVEKIAELVKAKEIDGISPDGLRDESDKDGMRVVIELKRGENAEVLLNKLYAQTQLETVFGINTVALVAGQPRILNLKDILEAFLRHRREVVTRRTIFEVRKARSRAHVLEGLTVALANIDEMIDLIKTSQDAAEARERMLLKRWQPGLVRSLLAAAGADRSRPEGLAASEGLFDDGYQLSELQAKEILEMRLQRLTGLEQEKLTDEYRVILANIVELFRILEEPGRLMEVIREELIAIREEYGDDRRTRIEHSQSDLDILDLIPPEDVVVTLSHTGYIKRQQLNAYRSQRRGGRGKSATALKDEDFIERLWIANTHDTLLAFSSLGRVFKLAVYQVPEASPGSRGRPIVNMLPLDANEKIQAVLAVKAFVDDRFVFFATRHGVVKKTPLSAFANVRANGIRAVELDEGDGLVNVALTDGECAIMLFGSHGKAVRFSEDSVRPMGRTARGVIGMRFSDDNVDTRVVGMLVVDGDGDLLIATARGFGKRTAVAEFPQKGRGTQGVIAIQTSERNGPLVGAIQLTEAHDVMLISNQGTLVRTRAGEISQVGRNTQGVTLIRLPEDEHLVGLVRLDALIEDPEDAPAAGEGGGLPPVAPSTDAQPSQPEA